MPTEQQNFAGIAYENVGPTGRQLYVYFDATALREFIARETLLPPSVAAKGRDAQNTVSQIIEHAGNQTGLDGRLLLGGKLCDILSMNWSLCEAIARSGGEGRFEMRLPVPA